MEINHCGVAAIVENLPASANCLEPDGTIAANPSIHLSVGDIMPHKQRRELFRRFAARAEAGDRHRQIGTGGGELHALANHASLRGLAASFEAIAAIKTQRSSPASC